MFTSLSIIIFSLVALTIFIHVRRGYKKGLTASLTSLCVILFSAVFGAFLSMLIGILSANALVDALSGMDFYEEVAGVMMGLENALLILVKMLLTLILYLPCLFLLRLLISIPVKIIVARTERKKDGNVAFNSEDEELYIRRHKAIAALLGALSGFIMAIICQAPIAGIAITLTDSVEFIETAAGDNELIGKDAKKAFDYIENDVSLAFVSACGGKMIFNFATSTFVDGEMVSLGDELEVIYDIDINEFSTLLEFESSALDNEARIASLVEKINQSKIMKVAFVDTLKGLSSAWLENKEYMGVKRPDIGADSAINDVVDSLLAVCKSTDSAHITADVTTLVNISSIVSDYKAIFSSGSYEDIVNTLTKDSVMDKVKTELSKNPRMVSVSAALDDVVMQIIAEEINDFKYSEEQRDIFYEQIAAILSDTSHLSGTTRVTKVTEQVKIAFSDYGIEVPEQLNEQVANQLIEGIEDGLGGDITYDSVYDYFEELINKGELPTGSAQ